MYVFFPVICMASCRTIISVFVCCCPPTKCFIFHLTVTFYQKHSKCKTSRDKVLLDWLCFEYILVGLLVLLFEMSILDCDCFIFILFFITKIQFIVEYSNAWHVTMHHFADTVVLQCTASPKSKPKWPDSTFCLLWQERPFPHVCDGFLNTKQD